MLIFIFKFLPIFRLIPHTCPWRVTSTENRAASVARETCHPAHSAIWWQSRSTDRAKGTSAQEGSHPQQSRQETLSPTRASRAGHQEDSYRRRWTRKRHRGYGISRHTIRTVRFYFYRRSIAFQAYRTRRRSSSWKRWNARIWRRIEPNHIG